jgi:poly(A) polymerase
MSAIRSQRDFALDIVTQLRAAGYEALWAGGCVRDQLLGIVPKDYDVATSATPDQIRDLFGRRRTLAIGAAFGVVTVLGPRTAGQIDVATFRADAPYSDGRHPDSVTFTTARQDAARRDFTINGLFYDPIADIIVDYVDGQQDLERRLIRAIGDAHLRLGEDKLRMLRAVRFAASFNFTIEGSTLRAIQAMAADITRVSAERIGMEIRRMLVDANRVRALDLLRETNLLPQVLPEVAALDAAAFDETRRVLAQFREPSLPLALAALLRNISPPLQGGARGGLTDTALSVVHIVGRRLRYTNKEIDRTAWLLHHVSTIERAEQSPWPALQRILIHDGAAELVALREAIAGPDDAALAYCRERLAWPREMLNPPPLVGGADLIAHGIAPGPQFAPLLEEIRDAQLIGEIQTPEEALALVDRKRNA